jgi:hypothetical protein
MNYSAKLILSLFRAGHKQEDCLKIGDLDSSIIANGVFFNKPVREI